MIKQRVAVVTGASSGIGRAIAGRLFRDGGLVVAGGRDVARLTSLAAEATQFPGEILPIAGDMTRPGYAEALLAAAEREWGEATVFVASGGRGLPGTVLTSDDSEWEDLVEANYLGLMRQLRACAAAFVDQAKADERGQARDIVVIGSTVGRQVSAANPVYGSTKFAVHALVEALRQEVCAHNIRVTLIEPGFVRSGFQAAAGYDPAWFERVAEENGPLLVPEDIAETVAFVIDRPAHVHLDDIRIRPTRQRV